MANGQNVSEFTMTMASVGPATMTTQFDIVNDSGKPNYLTSRWLSGKDIDKDTLKGGVNLTDTILLDVDGNADWVGANPVVTVQQEQTGTTWSTPWAILLGYMTWNEPTVDAVVGNQGPGGRKLVYKNLMYQLQQGCYQTMLNKVEGAVVSELPWYDVTENSTATDNRRPYSMLAGLNEYNTGTTIYATAPPTDCDVGGLGGAGLIPAVIDQGSDAWTTFQQIDPTASGQVNWRPYQDTYGTWYDDFEGGQNETIAAQDFWKTMSLAVREICMEQPAMGSKYTDPYTMPRVVYCSFQGEAYAEHLARVHNDAFRGSENFKDPSYHGMMFRGVPFQGIKSLGTIAFYVDDDDATLATTGLTELDSTGGLGANGAEHTGPRFYLFNGTYANFAVDSNRIFELSDPVYMGASGRPFSWVQYVKSYMQLYYRSRRRHGVLRPNGAKVTTA